MPWWSDLYKALRRPVLAIGCAVLAFVISIGAMSALLGTWPPFMAVESRSMQHSDSSSAIGIIDTGDVVVVSDPWAHGGIRTYLDSLQDGYRSFGGYGDVVVYQTPGQDAPIVHRAFCELVYNSTADGFDMPALANIPPSMWLGPDDRHGWQGLSDWVQIADVGYADVTVYIDLNHMLRAMGDHPHGGLITMGDHNWQETEGPRFGLVDQGSLVKEPIEKEWIVGKVVGEVPWVGTIRLWLTGTMPPYMPANSIALLMASVTSIAALPAALYASARALEQRRSR